ncbi:hypothetical protein GCWU000324_01849 [Kingella oralis ATCC 51147]|uniref:Uncharacterized protein n=1 Tax=Kingella oralis ATCC 51147 TaxID=629741 RepID=C4GIH8_9NEIS|nr:hypothetical protein GCWU000324_01849 [Kingella oralis ATCC 51147]
MLIYVNFFMPNACLLALASVILRLIISFMARRNGCVFCFNPL